MLLRLTNLTLGFTQKKGRVNHIWLATKIGWFSVVIDAHRPGNVLIRSRCRVDIFNLYRAHAATLSSMELPTSDESRDYRWTMSISKTNWVQLAGRLAVAVDYGSFMNEVEKNQGQANKREAYKSVYSTMYQVQLDEGSQPPKRRARKKQ
jgi:hypothetical protein